MYDFFLGLLLLFLDIWELPILLLFIFIFTISKLLERRNIDLIINKRIYISNSYEIKCIIPENPKTTLFLIKENEVIDNDIKTCTRKLLAWYIVGTNCYFVINRITGRINIFDEIHPMSKRRQKIFNELLSRPENKKL